MILAVFEKDAGAPVSEAQLVEALGAAPARVSRPASELDFQIGGPVALAGRASRAGTPGDPAIRWPSA
jgi:hypothetical protein